MNAIGQDYEPDDATFSEHIYKFNTPQFNLVNRSLYGNGCDFKHQIFEYRGKNCYSPSNGYCFIKCINFLTGEDKNKNFWIFLERKVDEVIS